MQVHQPISGTLFYV